MSQRKKQQMSLLAPKLPMLQPSPPAAKVSTNANLIFYARIAVGILGIMLVLFIAVLIAGIIIGVQLVSDESWAMTRIHLYEQTMTRLMAQTAREHHSTDAFNYLDPTQTAPEAKNERQMRLNRINALMESIEVGQSSTISDDEKLTLEMLASVGIRVLNLLLNADKLAQNGIIISDQAIRILHEQQQYLPLDTLIPAIVDDVHQLILQGIQYTQGLANGTETLRIRF